MLIETNNARYAVVQIQLYVFRTAVLVLWLLAVISLGWKYPGKSSWQTTQDTKTKTQKDIIPCILLTETTAGVGNKSNKIKT